MIAADSSGQVSYAGNGVTTVFPTGFKYMAAVDLLVELKLSGGAFITQVKGTHYNLDGEGLDAGGNVTMIAAPPAASTLRITRNTAQIQPTAFGTFTSFNPTTSHEQSFDRVTCEVQDIDRRVTALEAGGAPVSLAASKVTDTFVVLEPVETTFPRNVACVGTPSGVSLMRVEDLTDGTQKYYGLGEVGWDTPVLNQFRLTYVPGLVPGHNTRVTLLVITL